MPPDADVPAGWRMMLAIIGRCSDPEWVAERVGDDHRRDKH
jgi:hypothetical protein